ncbi:MAG: beta-ketoacyl-[acyl-carrier-protein] synthase family protein [Gemmataceae bacterium]
MTSERAVWITGIGTVNPLGTNYEETAEALLNGVSGVQLLTAFTLPEHLSQIAGLIGDIPVPPSWQKEEFRRLERIEQLLLCCAEQALRAAGLWDKRSATRVGLSLGLGPGRLSSWEDDMMLGGRQVFEPRLNQQTFLESVQQRLQISGPAVTCAAACASANFAVAQARRWIQLGWADVCIAGGAELAVTPISMSCFGNLRALSRRKDNPQAASRPFDRDRDGFVMSEGGVLFVLEAADHARRRGAPAYAELAGFGASSDAFHMVIPSTDPKPAVTAMRRALADARLDPRDVEYINAHATSTPAGDTAETKVLHTVFDEAIREIPVSSTKSMTGHLLSGAAAMNALACIVALRQQALPPTINLDEPDPECALCHIPHEARPRKVRIAVSNALGFGGSNTTIILRKCA